jgi:hypothetical protein
MTDITSEPRQASGWAVGGVAFAGFMMIMIGVFQFFQGLAAIINDQFFVVVPNYAYSVDVTAWGWIHLLIGVILILSGFFLFSGSAFARVVGVILAALSALANFFFIPYYPFWSLLMIAIAIYVIWALSRPDVFES